MSIIFSGSSQLAAVININTAQATTTFIKLSFLIISAKINMVNQK